jgi:hypothetical protein
VAELFCRTTDWLHPPRSVDHVVALGEQHLRRVLHSCASYYNETRTHRSLNKDAPIPRPVQPTRSGRCRTSRRASGHLRFRNGPPEYIFRYRAPIGSQLAVSRVRVASLDPQAGFDAQRTPEYEPKLAWRNASFDERFASLGDPPASFGERFSLFDEHPESFASAPPEPTNSVRPPPDRDLQNAAPPTGRLPNAPPIPVAAKRHVRPEQSQKDSVATGVLRSRRPRMYRRGRGAKNNHRSCGVALR